MIKLTDEQKAFLREKFENAEEMISSDDINDILKINEGRWQNVFVL